MTERFQITTDNASTHLMLGKTVRLFDRNYYSAEEIGEIINDGLKTALKMVRQVNETMTAEPTCLKWIDPKLLYDLTLASSTIMDVRTAATIAQAEKECEIQAFDNGSGQASTVKEIVESQTAKSENGHVDDSEPIDSEIVDDEPYSIDGDGEEEMNFLDPPVYSEGDEDDGIPF